MHSLEPLWDPEVPTHIRQLVPYQPGKPIEETKREFGLTEVIKIASNENPLGPSPKALQRIQAELGTSHLYPDASNYQLRTRLSSHLGCSLEELLITSGSDEAIDLLMRVFIQPNRGIVSPQYSFVAYKVCANRQGCTYKEAEVDETTLKPTADSVLETIDENTKAVFLANPNNPTGGYFSKVDLEQILKVCNQKKILVILDYAYWEYVTDPEIPDPLQVFRNHPNVIILRTFSKIYGLAGLRIGYVMARKNIISILARAKQPFNVTSIGAIAAEAALDDTDHVERSRKLNIESMVELKKALTKFPVKVFPSQGNFLLIDFGKPTEKLFPEFLKRGVIIRPVANYGLKNHFRVTCGLPTENRKFLSVMKEILK